MKADAAPRIEGDAKDFLLRLLDTPAPSGFEEPAAQLVVEYASSWADHVEIDAIGNVHVTVNRGAEGPRVAFAGHIDEIGFVVTRIEESGLVRFEQVGGWDLAVPMGQRVRVLTSGGVVHGTVGQLAPHQLKDRTKAPKLEHMWIDLGCVDADDAKSLVRIGDPIVLDTVPRELANGRWMSRSVDDRIGAFIALEVARHARGSGVEVVAICSTREENGCIGAEPATFAVAPDVGIAIDVMPTTDVPGDHHETCEIGKGPTIGIGAAVRGRIAHQLIDVAERAGIDVQIVANGRYTGTDADTMARAGAGVPVGVVSVPTRYLHSPGEVFALRDAEQTVDLLTRWAISQQR